MDKTSRCSLQKTQLGILSQPVDEGQRGHRAWAAFGLYLIAQIITPPAGSTEAWPAHGSHPNPAGPGTGAPQVALAPVQSSCEPAQLSRCPHGRCHQNQLGWGSPLLCLPPNPLLPKPHRAATVINDHFQRSSVLFSWKFLHHKFGNGQISKEFSQRTMAFRVC